VKSNLGFFAVRNGFHIHIEAERAAPTLEK
jgi:hypothetical protein